MAEDKVAAQPVQVGPFPEAVVVEAWKVDQVVLGSSVGGPFASCLKVVEAAPCQVASYEEGEVVVVGEPILMIWQVHWLWWDHWRELG